MQTYIKDLWDPSNISLGGSLVSVCHPYGYHSVIDNITPVPLSSKTSASDWRRHYNDWVAEIKSLDESGVKQSYCCRSSKTVINSWEVLQSHITACSCVDCRWLIYSSILSGTLQGFNVRACYTLNMIKTLYRMSP